MAITGAKLSLDQGDVTDLSALINNTLAIHQIWREIAPVLSSHAPHLAVKCVDRFTDNAFVAAGLRARHAQFFQSLAVKCEDIAVLAGRDQVVRDIAHAKAAEFVDRMNALANGLLGEEH